MTQLHVVTVGISLLTNFAKAETAILYSLGCNLGLRVYYMHETYRVPITLPVCGVPF